jgi:hypothetical protein
MNPLRFLLLSATSLFAVSLVSCVSVDYPQATAAELEMGRTLTPPKGQGLLVVYRKPGISMTTGKVPTIVRVDGKPHGANHAGTFVVVPVSKGPHVMHMDPNPALARGILSHSFQASPGKCYFIRQDVETKVDKILLVPTPAPVPRMEPVSSPVSEAVGRAEVAKCKQLGGNGVIKLAGQP